MNPPPVLGAKGLATRVDTQTRLFTGYLMYEDGEGGESSDARREQKTAADCQSVGEVVNTVGH